MLGATASTSTGTSASTGASGKVGTRTRASVSFGRIISRSRCRNPRNIVLSKT